MITKQLRTTEGTIKLNIPENLDELTIGQLRDIQEKENMTDLEAVSILANCPIETLYNVRKLSDLDMFQDAILKLTHAISFAYQSEKIPEYISIEGKKIKVIKNLTLEPAGAFLNTKDIIADQINKAIKVWGEETWREHFNPTVQSCIEVLSQYFYTRATDKTYTEYGVTEFQDVMKYLPVSEAIPIAKFFFLKYPNFEKTRIRFWQLARMWYQQRQASRRLKSLGV